MRLPIVDRWFERQTSLRISRSSRSHTSTDSFDAISGTRAAATAIC